MNVKNPDGTFKRSYRKWSSMLRRCYSPEHPAFEYYGGRGLEVCARWRGPGGYLNFVSDLGEPPEGLTLERINNDAGYSPDNCRWATWQEQAANKRRRGTVRPLDRNSLRQRAIAAGLPYHVVYLRIKRLFWPEERALSTPVNRRGRLYGATKAAGYKL